MARQPSSTTDVLLYFLALFVPFVPVFLKRGCGADFLINVCLCILGWLPGVLHAWYIISQTERNEAAFAVRQPVTRTY